MIVIIISEMKCVQYLKLIKQIFIQRIRIRIPRNFAQDNDFLNGGKKIWIKRCLIPWSYNCHQEIQKYIRIICKNVVDIIMQNHGQTDKDIKFLKGRRQSWTRRWLKVHSSNCHQEIQKYTSTISGNIVRNQVETGCCDCYYNIGNGVCPISETGNSMLYPEKKDKSS